MQSVLALRPVSYDESFFREAWFHEWDALREVLGQLVIEAGTWRRILDFGCGPGIMIDYMAARGFDYIGYDISNETRRLYLERFGGYPERYVTDLRELEMKNFDVLIAFDVLEHLRDGEIARMLERCWPIPELFVNINRNWRIPGHINLRTDRSWIRLFARYGFRLKEQLTATLRARYRELRPGCPDQWDRNMFVFSQDRSRHL